MLRAWYAWLFGNPIPAAQYLYSWLQQAFNWVMSQLDNQTQGQQNGYTGNFQAFSFWQSNHNRLLKAIERRIWWLYLHAYLGMGAWVSRRLAEDERWEAYWHDHLWRYTTWVADRAYYMINQLTQWVDNVVWKGLSAKVADLETKMLKWAFSSWSLLTHPSQLAGMLFWPIWKVFTQDPFTIANTIGDWLAHLVYANTLRTIHLAESILTDVL